MSKNKKIKNKDRRPIDGAINVKIDEIVELSQLVQLMADEPEAEKTLEGYIMFHF